MTNLLPDRAPPWWPRFQSRLRSRALTARIGRALGISFGICFVTGMLSHYQYQPWSFLPEPSAPVWGYRLTQGLHVLTGVLTIPLLLLKLWSVYPRLFTWPPVAGARNALERLSIAVLVSSALVELTTGFFNALDWYPWPWSFVPVHRFLGYVVIGSILLHVSIKLPDIRAGLRTRLAADDPPSDDLASATPAEPPAAGLTRRGLLTAVGAGIGGLGLVMAGQTVTPLSRLGLFAIRREQDAPQESLPVNRTAEQAAVAPLATDPGWSLQLRGPAGEMSLPLGRVERMVGPQGRDASWPIACVEGWSAGADWRGLRLLDLVERVGGDRSSRVRVVSLEPQGSYKVSYVEGPQLGVALLATHLNGRRLTLDHGYPLRLIAPDRAGVLNTKWLSRVEVL